MTFEIVRETHVDFLPLPKKTISRLKRLSVWYLEDFADLSEHDLLNERGFGLGTVAAISNLLKRVGLNFREEQIHQLE
jgi:DNA-directed RNA polymerase alpha subunit